MSSITTTEIAQLQPDKIGLSSSHWKQTNRGHYVRPLDGLEAFFTIPHTLGAEHKRQHWAMSTGIRIRTQRPNFAEDVRAAWISLRYRHPVLATKVEDGRFVYRIADGTSFRSNLPPIDFLKTKYAVWGVFHSGEMSHSLTFTRS